MIILFIIFTSIIASIIAGYKIINDLNKQNQELDKLLYNHYNKWSTLELVTVHLIQVHGQENICMLGHTLKMKLAIQYANENYREPIYMKSSYGKRYAEITFDKLLEYAK